MFTNYNFLYRRVATQYGMFYQLRVDGGREFHLSLGVQEHFADMRSRNDIVPYRQTQSKQVRLEKPS